MTPIASHYVDTSPRDEEPSGVRAKPVAPPLVMNAPLPTTSVEWLLADVCIAFGVAPRDVRSHERHKQTARARHAFWWLARRLWQYSYSELGRLLGEPFSHTTIIIACRGVEREVNAGTHYGRIVQRFIETPPVTSGARFYEERRGAPIEISESEGPTSSSGSNEESGQ